MLISTQLEHSDGGERHYPGERTLLYEEKRLIPCRIESGVLSLVRKWRSSNTLVSSKRLSILHVTNGLVRTMGRQDRQVLHQRSD